MNKIKKSIHNAKNRTQSKKIKCSRIKNKKASKYKIYNKIKFNL